MLLCNQIAKTKKKNSPKNVQNIRLLNVNASIPKRKQEKRPKEQAEVKNLNIILRDILRTEHPIITQMFRISAQIQNQTNPRHTIIIFILDKGDNMQ